MEEAGEKYIQAIEEQREMREHLSPRICKENGRTAGFKVETEVLTPDGGRIDTVLIKNNVKIACEISVTNTLMYEVKNLKKCIMAGYEKAIMICNNESHLRNIKCAVERITSVNYSNVSYCTSNSFKNVLDQYLAQEEIVEIRTRGYRIKTFYQPTVNRNNQKKTIEAMLKSLRRTK